MHNNYPHLARKLKLLAHPRLRISATDDALAVDLLSHAAEPSILVGYAFNCKHADTDLSRADIIMGLSAFLETAAVMLAERPAGQQAAVFAQNLYNQGFWINPAGASAWFVCKITSMEFDPAKW